MLTQRKNIAGVVILYCPNEDVISNITSYASALDQVWVIDNSETMLISPDEILHKIPNAIVIQDGINKGIGARINYALSESHKLGYKWLLTMDQDSAFTEENLDKYLDAALELEGVDEQIGQLGVEYSHLSSTAGNVVQFENVDMLITSGTLIKVAIIEPVGFMNEELFIDEVDSDFSYRVILNGFRSLLCKGIFMIHHLGERRMARSLKNGRKTERYFHSPSRLYYITRNYFLMRKRYKKDFAVAFKERDINIFHVYKNNLLYNPNKWQSLKMIVKGYIDFRNERFGKLH